MARKSFTFENPATAYISNIEPAAGEGLTIAKAKPDTDLKPARADAGKKSKNERITLILPGDLLETIDNLKWTAKMNRQEVIRQAVKEFLDNHKEEF